MLFYTHKEWNPMHSIDVPSGRETNALNDGPQLSLAEIEDEKATNSCSPCCAHCNSPMRGDDAVLVQGCLNGDPEAWTLLIDKYKRMIYSVPLKYGACPEDAADIFQAVCIEALHGLGRLKNADSLRSWLITVAIRQSYRWRKRQLNVVELDALEPEIAEKSASVTEIMEQMQQEQIVREVVEKLPPRCSQLVRLLFFEQPPLPYAEVARRLGLATGSIGFIRGRCLERLRKLLVDSGFKETEIIACNAEAPQRQSL
ncbi:MAG: RNA polymerase sigma factor [Candidatus Angelobacter sp.]